MTLGTCEERAPQPLLLICAGFHLSTENWSGTGPAGAGGQTGGIARRGARMNRIWLRAIRLMARAARCLPAVSLAGWNAAAAWHRRVTVEGAYSVTVEMVDGRRVAELTGRVDDVTVGSVAGIVAVQRPDGFLYAAVKLDLDKNVLLLANAVAKVSQTPLLGSGWHVELARRRGTAADREVIECRGTRTMPTRPSPLTEEVFGAGVVSTSNVGALRSLTRPTGGGSVAPARQPSPGSRS